MTRTKKNDNPEPCMDEYGSRGPLLQHTGDYLHVLRNMQPLKTVRLSRSIVVTWPKWEPDADRWRLDLMSESDHLAGVRIYLWPEGRAEAKLLVGGEVVQRYGYIKHIKQPETPADVVAGIETAFAAAYEFIEPVMQHLAKVA